MTTNNISFISKMFVVIITFLGTVLTIKFNILDLTYLLFVIGCFTKYINLKQNEE